MKTHEHLKAYVDGELSPELAAEMESQIGNDPELDREARMLRALGEEIRGLAVPISPVAGEKTLRAVKSTLWQRLAPVKWQIAGLGAISTLALAALLIAPMAAQPREAAMRTPSFPSGADTAEMAKNVPEPNYANPMGEPTEDKSLNAAARAVEGERFRSSRDMNPQFRESSRRLMTSMGNKSASGMTTAKAHEFMRPKLIRSSDLEIKVNNAFEAHDSFQRTVRDWDGFVLNANVSTVEKTTRATLQVRVPEGRFEEALLALRKMGQVLRENSTGEDVTAQVIDSRTRVEILADEESNLVKRLAAAKSEQQRSVIRYELTRIRIELQSWKAQAKALDEQTKYSTLNVSFVSDGSSVSGGRFGETWSNATGALGGVGTGLGQMLIYVGVFSPIWLPLVLIGWLVYRRRV